MSSKNKKAKGKDAAGKGKKGKSKDQKKTEIKLSRVEETFYQLTVADCEKKINHLRKHLQFLDENNDEIKEQIRSLNEDKVDPAAVMTNKVNAANETIYIFNEKIYVLSQEYFDVKSRGDATITDLEEKFKAMHDQLTAEIKIRKAHLNLLKEFPNIDMKLNYINELEEERKREKEQEMKELIESTERRIKGEREAMRKEIERKMLHVSEEFTRSSTLRNAAYTQRLIRENIALEKEIKILESTWRSMDQQLKEQVVRHKEVKATFPALNQKKRELIMVAQAKTSLIEMLTTKYESIKSAYVESLLYKTKYEELIKSKLCANFERRELLKQAKKYGYSAHTLKTDCLQLEDDYENNKNEIENLKIVIALIRGTILEAIGIHTKRSKLSSIEPTAQGEVQEKKEADMGREKVSETSFFEYDELQEAEFNEEELGVDESVEEYSRSRNRNLLETLFEMLQFYKMHKLSTTSLPSIPYDDLLKHHAELIEPSTVSLGEEFKHGIAADDLCKEVSDQLAPVPQIRQLIPKERRERCHLFDVEKGSTLYVSEPDSNKEVISVQDPGDDKDDEPMDSSSDYSEAPAPAATTAAPASAPETTAVEQKDLTLKLSLSEMPAGTILDVEMAEEVEDEDIREPEPDDIYLADADSEQVRAEDNEGEEEEMPIYMFY